MNALSKYHWPGNVRELENLIKRYVILGTKIPSRASYALISPIFSVPISTWTDRFR